MTVTISRLYDRYSDAQSAVRSLEAAGVPHSDISIVANNSDNWFSADKKVDRDRDGVDDRAEGAGKGAGIGAGLGGAAGLLAGLGLLAIPGLGPGGRRRLACRNGCRCCSGCCHGRACGSSDGGGRLERRGATCMPKASAAAERWFPPA